MLGSCDCTYGSSYQITHRPTTVWLSTTTLHGTRQREVEIQYNRTESVSLKKGSTRSLLRISLSMVVRWKNGLQFNIKNEKSTWTVHFIISLVIFANGFLQIGKYPLKPVLLLIFRTWKMTNHLPPMTSPQSVSHVQPYAFKWQPYYTSYTLVTLQRKDGALVIFPGTAQNECWV